MTVTGLVSQRGWDGNDGRRRPSREGRFPRVRGVSPRRGGQQQAGFNAPKGGQQGDPWAQAGAPF